MLDPIIGALAGDAAAIKFQIIVFVILGTIALMLISLLFDLIRRAIRGLDFTLLGLLLILVGKLAEGQVIQGVSDLLYLIGATLTICGIFVFIIIKSIRRKRKERAEIKKQQEIEGAKRAAEAALIANSQQPRMNG